MSDPDATQAFPRPRRTDAGRTAPLPVVKPIPDHRRPPADPIPQHLITADLVATVLRQQHDLNTAAQARRPSVKDVAAARARVAEREERRKLRHLRHMDALEVTRAYLGITLLIALTVLVVILAYLAFGVLVGWHAVGPIHKS